MFSVHVKRVTTSHPSSGCGWKAVANTCAHWQTHALHTRKRVRVWGALSVNYKVTYVNSYPPESQTIIISCWRQKLKKKDRGKEKWNINLDFRLPPRYPRRQQISWNINWTSIQRCRKVMYCSRPRLRDLNFHQKCQVIAQQNSWPTSHILWVRFSFLAQLG
jgi:hypothetical protein